MGEILAKSESCTGKMEWRPRERTTGASRNYSRSRGVFALQYEIYLFMTKYPDIRVKRTVSLCLVEVQKKKKEF
jgi:hypothetical protein